MSFAMQRFMQSWTGQPPQQRASHHQAPPVQAGYVTPYDQPGYSTQAQCQAQQQAQQMATERMTRGQTGARCSPHPTNQRLPQSVLQVPQMSSQQFSSGLRTSVPTGATTPPPQLGTRDPADGRSPSGIDDDTIVVNASEPSRTLQMNGSHMQSPPQQTPNLAQMNRQTQHVSPVRVTRSHTAASPPQQQPVTTSQSQSLSPSHPTAEFTAQNNFKGPIIGHGPNGPIYLHGPSTSSPRRRQPQFSLHEDESEASGSNGGRKIQSPMSARKKNGLGRRNNEESQRDGRGQAGMGRGSELFLPR